MDVVIIKNLEILDLVSLFEDAYGTSHAVIEERLNRKGHERLSQGEEIVAKTTVEERKKEDDSIGTDAEIEDDMERGSIVSPTEKPKGRRPTLLSPKSKKIVVKKA